MNVATMRYLAILFFIVITQCTSNPRTSLSDPFHCITPRLKNGKVRARGRGRIIRFSCYSDYDLVGNKYSTCIRGSWDTPTPICVSTRCAPVPVPKHAVVGEKYNGAILMYFCEPGYVLVGNAEIYCDGKQWNGSTPFCRDSNSVAPTSCDFEKEDLCWWEQDPKHDFDWQRHRSDTPSSHIGTGPTYDHTLGRGNDGYYLYIEASGRLIDDTARILSPLYSANLTESGCFSFWYHMYGATVGSLNVYFRPENESTPKLMWSKRGNQGNQWLHGWFDLPTVNCSFQLTIEGVRGLTYVSDIAIDDIAILQGDECPSKNLNISTIATPADGDEVEIFNAMQSCRDRCVNNTLDVTVSPEMANGEACICTIDCAEYGICCPDYAEYCIYEDPQEFTETWSKYVTATISTSPQIQNATEKSTPINTSSTGSTKTTVAMKTATPMQTTESTVPSSTERSTMHLVTTSKTPTTTRGTTKESITTYIVKSTTLIPTINGTTYYNPVEEFTTSKEVIEIQTEEHISIVHTNELKHSATLSLPGIIEIVAGILCGIMIITIITLVMLRKRKPYSRGSSGGFSEDSDVLFRASNEALNFNLAKPAPDGEET